MGCAAAAAAAAAAHMGWAHRLLCEQCHACLCRQTPPTHIRASAQAPHAAPPAHPLPPPPPQETGLVIKHVESWDVDPGTVVRSLLKPASRVPSSEWEVLMDAVSRGSAGDAWLAVSGRAAPLATALAVLSVALGLGLGDATPVRAPAGAARLLYVPPQPQPQPDDGNDGNPCVRLLRSVCGRVSLSNKPCALPRMRRGRCGPWALCPLPCCWLRSSQRSPSSWGRAARGAAGRCDATPAQRAHRPDAGSLGEAGLSSGHLLRRRHYCKHFYCLSKQHVLN
jgi:hypothetical protein